MKILKVACGFVGSLVVSVIRTLLVIGFVIGGAASANYLMTVPGSGTSFASVVISTVHYAAGLICDATNGQANCSAVKAGNTAAAVDQALVVADPNVLAAVAAPPTLGSASGGLTIKTLVGLTNTAGGTAVKASAGQVYKAQCYNPDATNSAVLEFFNTGTVTLGTTPVFDFVEIGPGSNAGFTLSLVGAQYSTAITVAAVKTIGTSTAPTTAIDCTVYYN